MKKKKSNLTIFLVLTTITLLTWVVFDAYSRFTRKDLHQVPAGVLEALDPSLDGQTLDMIEERKYFSKEEIEQFSPAPQTEEAEASPSANDQNEQ